ncbi:hypothetical protein ACQJBY_031061 [Aegilops geniculata]
MPDRRRATLLEDLPGELIDKILVRLTPKDVGRCRAVRTSWRDATSTSEFMLEHHRLQRSLPIINGQGRPTTFVVFHDVGAKASSQEIWPCLLGAKQHLENSIQAACDGFLIIYRRSRFYICNPLIRMHAVLPQPQVGKAGNNVIGFYRHHPTGEYRVLWVSRSHIFSLYVLTVGSAEPRHVTVRIPTTSRRCVGHASVEHMLLNGLNYLPHCPPPIDHHGSLHWCPYSTNEITGDRRDIIVFDTKVESFRWMHGPAQPYSNRRLFKMKETLAFWGSSTPRFTAMDVWVMLDYDAEIWSFKYRIDVSTVEASRQRYLTSFKNKMKTPLHSTVQWFNDTVVLHERELLIRFNSKYVLRLDIDGKFLGMVNIGKSQYRMLLTQHRLKDNITPIMFRESQKEDKESPFSAGLV